MEWLTYSLFWVSGFFMGISIMSLTIRWLNKGKL